MKSLKYILIGVIICIIGSSCTSFSKKNNPKVQVLTLQCQSFSFPRELLAESKVIITKRLEYLNIRKFSIEESIDLSQLIISFDEKIDIQYISDILIANGKVNFLETVERGDILKNLHNGLNTPVVQKLDSLLNIRNGKKYPDAIIGQAKAQDTTVINKFFKSETVKQLLPSNIKLCWSSQSNDSKRFDLYLLSSVDSGINEASISEAHLSKGAKYIAVSMVFKQNFWSSWENLTKTCLNKSIAFVIDNRVYSAPMVRSVITGGKIELTGGFSEQEASKLVAIISSGRLPLDFEIK